MQDVTDAEPKARMSVVRGTFHGPAPPDAVVRASLAAEHAAKRAHHALAIPGEHVTHVDLLTAPGPDTDSLVATITVRGIARASLDLAALHALNVAMLSLWAEAEAGLRDGAASRGRITDVQVVQRVE